MEFTHSIVGSKCLFLCLTRPLHWTESTCYLPRRSQKESRRLGEEWEQERRGETSYEDPRTWRNYRGTDHRSSKGSSVPPTPTLHTRGFRVRSRTDGDRFRCRGVHEGVDWKTRDHWRRTDGVVHIPHEVPSCNRIHQRNIGPAWKQSEFNVRRTW